MITDGTARPERSGRFRCACLKAAADNSTKAFLLIASILPGLREVRTPLAVGYLWLFIVWITVHRAVPSPGDAFGLLGDIYNLLDYFGQAGLIGVLTFIAFLIGTVLSVDLTKPVRRFMYPNSRFESWAGLPRRAVPSLRRFQRINSAMAELADRNQAGLIDVWMRRTTRQAASQGIAAEDYIAPEQDERAYANARDLSGRNDVRDFLDELPVLVNRLSVHDKTGPWQTYDRKSAEAAFRGCVAAPLMIAVAILSASVYVGLALLLLIPPVLLIMGVDRAVEADADVLEAALQGVITSDVLDAQGAYVWTSKEHLDRLADDLFESGRAFFE